MRKKPASQREIMLFAMMGQALLNIQVLEECLSMATTLKVDVGYPRKISRKEADELLKKRRSLTLGQAVNKAVEKNLYEENLQTALKALTDERNWLVHRSIDDFYAPAEKDAYFTRLANIANEAHRIQCEIEDDLIEFAQSNGLDMSSVKEAISQWRYHEN